MPLHDFHVPKSLLRTIRTGKFDVVLNKDFEQVMRHCARPRPNSPGTWISEELIEAYTNLHRLGFAHSVECWYQDELAGGLYGVAINGVFMGESMFTLVRDASKVALYHLVEHLKSRSFQLLDVQFSTDHLTRFGAVQIPREEYETRLENALQIETSFV